jgi:hypothetical protein
VTGEGAGANGDAQAPRVSSDSSGKPEDGQSVLVVGTATSSTGGSKGEAPRGSPNMVVDAERDGGGGDVGTTGEGGRGKVAGSSGSGGNVTFNAVRRCELEGCGDLARGDATSNIREQELKDIPTSPKAQSRPASPSRFLDTSFQLGSGPSSSGASPRAIAL